MLIEGSKGTVRKATIRKESGNFLFDTIRYTETDWSLHILQECHTALVKLGNTGAVGCCCMYTHTHTYTLGQQYII